MGLSPHWERLLIRGAKTGPDLPAWKIGMVMSLSMLVKFVYFWPGWRVRGTEVQGHVLKTRFHTLSEAQWLLCV